MQANTIDLLGAVSEIAFCREFGACPDLSVKPRKGGADVIFKGKRWDIKSTKRANGQLLATTEKTPGEVDFYALAVVQDNIVDFIGYASEGELLCEDTITDLGHGPTHALPQSRLRQFPPKSEA